jgi:hypothetical protein
VEPDRRPVPWRRDRRGPHRRRGCSVDRIAQGSNAPASFCVIDCERPTTIAAVWPLWRLRISSAAKMLAIPCFSVKVSSIMSI